MKKYGVNHCAPADIGVFMKRAISAFILFAIIISMQACSDPFQHAAIPSDNVQNEQTFNTNTDFDNRFGRVYEGLVETDEVYYWLSVDSGFVYYVEKDGNGAAPLCGKPNCMHELDTDKGNCNANTKKYLPGLSLYDGKLYFVSTDRSNPQYCCALCRMDPDGTNHERVFFIDTSDYAIQRFWIHRGIVFVAAYTNIVKDGVPLVSICLLCGNLNGTGIAPVLERLYPADECGWPLFFMKFYGNTAFFAVSACSPSDSTALNEIYEYDIDSGAVTERYSAAGCDFQMCDLCMDDNKNIYVSSFATCWDRPVCPSVYLLNDDHFERKLDFDDGTEYGRILLFDRIAVAIHTDVSIHGADTVWVRRLNGDTIAKGALSRDFINGRGDLQYGGCDIAVDEGHIYCFYCGWVKDDYSHAFFVRYDISGGSLNEMLLAEQ